MRIKLYEVADLEKIVAEGSKSFASQAMWINMLVASFAAIVRRRPLAYRTFGPFWWPLKAMMVKSGELPGETPDPDLVAQVTMGSAALDVAAAWAQHEYNVINMIIESSFTVDTEDGETIEYRLYDEEMLGGLIACIVAHLQATTSFTKSS